VGWFAVFQRTWASPSSRQSD